MPVGRGKGVMVNASGRRLAQEKSPFTKQRHGPAMPFSACARNKEPSEAHTGAASLTLLTLLHFLPFPSFYNSTLA